MPNVWHYWTWSGYYDDCMKFAKALVHLKCSMYGVVNILGFNSPEWFISNNGSILAGCIAAGIYATNAPDACAYITQHSQAGVVVVDGNKQLAKYAEMAKTCPALKAIVVYDEKPDKKLSAKCGVDVYFWDDFLNLGNRVKNSEIERRQASVRPGNCSTLIYTSGTTGPPKAVMISHDNAVWTTGVMAEAYMDINHTDRIVSYLPLSHIAAQIIDLHIPMRTGACTYFCQPDALKGTLTVTMAEVHPTIFFGVPRVWEKIQEKMLAIGRETKGALKVLSTWAKSQGMAKSQMNQYPGTGKPLCYGCANAVVLSKIKKKLGLDQAKACFTAAAPIAPETVWYFASLDIPVYEVFGQSECTGPHTVSAPGVWKVGMCGRPLYGTESKIEPDGELAYRGRHIFMGYMYMEDKTKETIDSDGFMHSGDVAEFDDDGDEDIVTAGPSGFMRITGRIKELIITAGGENIPPVLIENEMKAAMPALSNCMVVGDRRKYLAMLVSLKTEMDADGVPTDNLSADSLFFGKEIGSEATTLTAAATCPKWKAYLDDGMKVANGKTTSNAQIVQKWAMLPVDFSEKAGDLTPTLKLKRNVVSEKYADFIEDIYA